MGCWVNRAGQRTYVACVCVEPLSDTEITVDVILLMVMIKYITGCGLDARPYPEIFFTSIMII